jgi:MFS transporter, DHA1 family, multidrug resistance protein
MKNAALATNDARELDAASPATQRLACPRRVERPHGLCVHLDRSLSARDPDDGSVASRRARHDGVDGLRLSHRLQLRTAPVGPAWRPVRAAFAGRDGLVFFIIGSAGCAMASDAWHMIGWRIVQAVGACAGVVLARAMVRDLYAGDRAAQRLSTLITVMAVAPLLGPAVGGQILNVAGWRAIFWVLVAVGLATLAALFTIPETLAAERRNTETLVRAISRYGALARDARLLAYAGVGAFFYGGVYAYIAGTPFAFITYHHVPSQLYGVLFAAGILGIMATNTVNARLVLRLGSFRLLQVGAAGAALAGVVSGVAAWTGWGGLFGLAVPLLVFVSFSGLIVANSIVGALTRFPDRAGAVSAFVGAVHYGTGILGSALVGAFADGTPWPMGWTIAASGIGSALCAWLAVRSHLDDKPL